MSIRPSAACAFLTKFSASAGLVRSAVMAKILRPVSLAISAAVASSGSFRRAQIATSTPSRASARAIALPMPSLAPVTSAFLSFIARSMAASPSIPAPYVRALSSRILILRHQSSWINRAVSVGLRQIHRAGGLAQDPLDFLLLLRQQMMRQVEGVGDQRRDHRRADHAGDQDRILVLRDDAVRQTEQRRNRAEGEACGHQ